MSLSLPSSAEIHKLLSNTKLRLIQEHGWDDDFVNAAINEYIRFLELRISYPDKTILP